MEMPKCREGRGKEGALNRAEAPPSSTLEESLILFGGSSPAARKRSSFKSQPFRTFLQPPIYTA
ncbi:MAG: hypothetical protein DRZ90_07745 [Spirochaetes bacterium]|nr:MAG: hypothetical protein DRZ90_07745 [Spirochaetota bacterium]